MSANIDNIDNIKLVTESANIIVGTTPSAPATQMHVVPSNKIYKYTNVIVSHPDPSVSGTQFTLSVVQGSVSYPCFTCIMGPEETVHAVTTNIPLVLEAGMYLSYKAIASTSGAVDNMTITWCREEISL
jgi:hypothetical protein